MPTIPLCRGPFKKLYKMKIGSPWSRLHRLHSSVREFHPLFGCCSWKPSPPTTHFTSHSKASQIYIILFTRHVLSRTRSMWYSVKGLHLKPYTYRATAQSRGPRPPGGSSSTRGYPYGRGFLAWSVACSACETDRDAGAGATSHSLPCCIQVS